MCKFITLEDAQTLEICNEDGEITTPEAIKEEAVDGTPLSIQGKPYSYNKEEKRFTPRFTGQNSSGLLM